MCFEEPKHDPVSSAFLTAAHKNVVIIFNKEQKNKMYVCRLSLGQYRNMQQRKCVPLCVYIYIYVCVYAGVKQRSLKRIGSG
jgi:hypothetical protein